MAGVFVVVGNEPRVEKKSLPVTMEDPRHLALLTELRQDAWQRSSRSIVRKEARHDWKVKQATIARKRAAEARRQATIAAKRKADRNNQRVITSGPVNLSGIAACIAEYESGGNPTAQNPESTASGLYQFLDSTWNNYGGYSRAMYAPVSLQTEKFYQVWNGGAGASQWVVAGSCGY